MTTRKRPSAKGLRYGRSMVGVGERPTIDLPLYLGDKAKKINVEGWRIPTMKDYNDMKDMLVSYGASMPALKMFDDNARLAKDLTGFNLKFQGYWEGSNKTNEGKRSAFWANIPVGGSTYTTAVFLDKSGEMQTGPNEYASTAVNIGALVSQYSVRMVMK